MAAAKWTESTVFRAACLVLVVAHVELVSGDSEACKSYSAKLTSVPDLSHRIVYQERRYNDLQILDVKNTNYQRSFYWCQLDVMESDNKIKRYRHFGFNSTHWWVEMGCGGWFIVTECRADNFFTPQGIMGVRGKDDSSLAASISVEQFNKDRKKLTIIDEIYKDWPKQGYRFPTSGKMWDFLDNATYVDVAAQLGFYNSYGKPGSTLFD